MKYKNWKVPSAPPVVPRSLEQAVGSRLLAAILHLRGLGGLDDAESFLLGGMETLHDPCTLTDILPAIQRITRAIDRAEHVAVYGDYDVDGITSACLLTDYLRSRGLRCETYIPDRLGEGYGLNTGALEKLRDMGVTLVITVDCGVTSLEETAYADSLGIDMIITDHHECREELPDAVAVVDPKRPDCPYPGTGLAGVGVAFKLVCALEGNTETMLERYGDLLAVGTVADVMPVTGENRYMIRLHHRLLPGPADQRRRAAGGHPGRRGAAADLLPPPGGGAGQGAVREEPGAAKSRNGHLEAGRGHDGRAHPRRAHRAGRAGLASGGHRHRGLPPHRCLLPAGHYDLSRRGQGQGLLPERGGLQPL